MLAGTGKATGPGFFRVGGEEYPVGDGPSWPLSEPRWERTLWWQTARKGWARPGKEVFAFGSRVEKPPRVGTPGFDDKHAGVSTMVAKADETKGRVKEAAGGLSGDDEA